MADSLLGTRLTVDTKILLGEVGEVPEAPSILAQMEAGDHRAALSSLLAVKRRLQGAIEVKMRTLILRLQAEGQGRNEQVSSALMM
ncbi:MAG: hypothetical protein V4480_02175 [Patescibacteria group bacterium]